MAGHRVTAAAVATGVAPSSAWAALMTVVAVSDLDIAGKAGWVVLVVRPAPEAEDAESGLDLEDPASDSGLPALAEPAAEKSSLVEDLQAVAGQIVDHQVDALAALMSS